jgi:regulator of protease activity HflC (stomatin/prohibitin superfamily)
VEALVVVIVLAAAIALLVAVVSRFVAKVTVYEYERGLRYDDGRFTGALSPGAYRILRSRTRIDRVDVRPTLASVPGQEVVTRDGVSIRISLVAEYELADPVVASVQHGDAFGAMYASLQVALREAAATTDVDDLLERRGELGAALQARAAGDVERVGLRLLRVEAKDFMFPGELRRSFAQVVVARKEGLAALERARGETAALRNLANAARAIEGNPMLLQLRLLQELGKSGGNTVVLGLPSTTTPLPLREATAGEAPEELEGGDRPDA